MDAASARLLAHLIRDERIGALATLRAGAPMVSMVLYLPADDFSVFHVHVSRLAWHTQDMERDARVALAIVQCDDPAADPQQLARVTVRGTAERVADAGTASDALRDAWLVRYPQSAINFSLADFAFWRITPTDARLVAGFGSIHNLSSQALREAAAA